MKGLKCTRLQECRGLKHNVMSCGHNEAILQSSEYILHKKASL